MLQARSRLPTGGENKKGDSTHGRGFRVLELARILAAAHDHWLPLPSAPMFALSPWTPPRVASAFATFLLAAGSCAATESAAAGFAFTEVAASAGLTFRHESGARGQLWLAEIMGGGVGVLDCDNDGRLDVWLVQSGDLTAGTQAPRADRLYRNVSDQRAMRFVDISTDAGVGARGYGMGIASGDIDGDGDGDVLLTGHGTNQLFENLGNCKFRDVTAESGIAANVWSVSASFTDYDVDGRLDLYVGNYVDFSLANHQQCVDPVGQPAYCKPTRYRPLADRLYRNMGDRRFVDVSAKTGIAVARTPTLGVIAEDFDADGRIDFYIANDPTDNVLWMHQGNGTFADTALLAGVAVNAEGKAQAGMGVDAADHDGDGDVDLFVTNLTNETNALYANDGKGWFQDLSTSTGAGPPSLPMTGFGTCWADFDNDGFLDLFAANGAVTVAAGKSVTAPGALAQPHQLLRGDRGRYKLALVDAFAKPTVGRGAVCADLDNDGDVDIVVGNIDDGPRLYRNDTRGGHWLGIELAGAEGGAQVLAIGSGVWREANGHSDYRRVATDGSYASANDARVHFGLGAETTAQHVRVRWPDGHEERFGPLRVDAWHRLQRQRAAAAAR